MGPTPVPPETSMPRSWLMPAFAVQRSALALNTAVAVACGVTVSVRLVGSRSTHVAPSLLVSQYCCAAIAVYGKASPGVTLLDIADSGLESTPVTAFTAKV